MYRNKSVELVLDKRLSFKDNFLLFRDNEEIRKFARKTVMAEKGRYALRMDIPLNELNIPPFTRLYIF